MPTTLPGERHIGNPFRDPAFLARHKAATLVLERRRKVVETDVFSLKAATIDPTTPALMIQRVAYRLLVRCSILATMNLVDCEAEALEESFFNMKEQIDQGADHLLAFQGHIDTVIAASHMSKVREVLPVVWQELAPFIRLLTEEHWLTFERLIAWCSAQNIWDDRNQIRSNIRLLRQTRRLIINKTPMAD